MNITVLGAGNMGSAFVNQLTRAGHQVTVTARDLSHAEQVAAAHPGKIICKRTGIQYLLGKDFYFSIFTVLRKVNPHII